MPTISIIGATGFTGSLVAKYLIKNAPLETRISLVGRSLSKLESLKKTLGGTRPLGAVAPDLIVASSEDTASIDNVVSRSTVVVCTAGPFLRIAGPIVASCARQGVDYVDITGETPFVRQTIDRHDSTAKETGAFIVNMCGFDSVPSDLGCWRTVQRARRELGEGTRRVSCFATMRGALSGGTLESGMEMERDPNLFRMLKDPFLLGGRPLSAREEDKDVQEAALLCLPHESSSGAATADTGTAASADHDGGLWTSVFMMAELNTRTVRRSHSLFGGLQGEGAGYGSDFGYSERMMCGSEGEAAKLARPAPPVGKREAMRSEGRLPKQGEGPSEEQRAKSRFKFFFVGEGEDSGRRVVTSVSGGDPGYDETAKMVSEAALALAFDRDEMHATKVAGLKGGVVTPAFAFGEVLEGRLKRAGISLADEGTIFEPDAKGDQRLRSLLGTALASDSTPKSAPSISELPTPKL